jgi:Flp pilus assembly protein protease CpaA
MDFDDKTILAVGLIFTAAILALVIAMTLNELGVIGRG